jgi:wyosine [tRNA(Phe)-imidazoG37] synthetase (radical SAM superfamily)
MLRIETMVEKILKQLKAMMQQNQKNFLILRLIIFHSYKKHTKKLRSTMDTKKKNCINRIYLNKINFKHREI